MNTWQEAARILPTVPTGAERDEYIDALAGRILTSPSQQEETAAIDFRSCCKKF